MAVDYTGVASIDRALGIIEELKSDALRRAAQSELLDQGLLKVYELGRTEEREACAKLVEEIAARGNRLDPAGQLADEAAAAIRTRGTV